jgi:hypothetical protein
MSDQTRWWEAEAIIEEHEGVLVVREDLIAGGSKIRFLPALLGDERRELVYGSPFCGGAQLALATWGARQGVPITLFFAKRKALHWRQREAFRLGASIYQVPAGRMSVVQKRAQVYATSVGARLLPLGFDAQGAAEPFEAAMRLVAERVGPLDEVWCATGSGLLAACLGRAFPDASIKAVAVGLASRHGAQHFPPNVTILSTPYDFSERARTLPPFNACAHYEAKAWERLVAEQKGRALFWNVAGDRPAAAV